jgi:hypothetical protein
MICRFLSLFPLAPLCPSLFSSSLILLFLSSVHSLLILSSLIPKCCGHITVLVSRLIDEARRVLQNAQTTIKRLLSVLFNIGLHFYLLFPLNFGCISSMELCRGDKLDCALSLMNLHSRPSSKISIVELFERLLSKKNLSIMISFAFKGYLVILLKNGLWMSMSPDASTK